MTNISVASLFFRHLCTDLDIFGFSILRHDQVYIPVVGYLFEANILPLSAQELSIILNWYAAFLF